MEKNPIGHHEDALLREQKREFTNEGAPPPGVVGSDLPAASPIAYPGTQTVAAKPDPAECELNASLEHRVRVAEEERDVLATFGQEELYLRACARVDALERQLEERVMHSGSAEPLT